MRAVVQRVLQSDVKINNKIVSSIDSGLVILLGFKKTDGEEDFKYMVKKIIGLRIFEDENNKMNLSAKDLQKEILVVPNFTLYGDVRKGFRPSFTESAGIDEALEMFNKFIDMLKKDYEQSKVQKGVFQGDMQVSLINDGPITIILDSDKIL